ncbi:MAG TPA: PQQ-binding-like beta-propeller repeat protein, partial [Fibrobacteria bacterium]|nr:PQQ-binding-like beta-propeller repeat protein [Fibrobacteria bacterium]
MGKSVPRGLRGRIVTRDPRATRSAARGSVALACAIAFMLAPKAHAADARDSAYAEERRALESARYLRETEGDTVAAKALLERLDRSGDPGIRAQARYLRAGFLEESGAPGEAAKLYRQVLESGGLEPAQERRLVAHLLTLDPEAVRPFRPAGRMRGLPARVFESTGPTSDDYVLAEDPAGGTRGMRLFRQGPDGLLELLNVALPADEEVLDAAPDRLLTRSASRQRVFLRRAPDFAPEAVRERFAVGEGALLSGDPDEFLLLDGKEFRHMRGARTLFTQALPGPDCAWRAAVPRGRTGVVLCPEHGLLRADFGRHALTPLPLGGEAPSEAIASGEYLALRYPDRVEVRRGPAFDAALWTLPASLQDAVALGRSQLFIASADGFLRAFALRTGQPEWQREQDASGLSFRDGELLVTGSDRTLTVLSERGRPLYAYEPSRDGEQDPVVLPGRDWIVVQSADGRRVRLDRGLLRIVGQNRDYLLRASRDRARRGDGAGALRALDSVLAFEPGNGSAWREKAVLLGQTGAARMVRARAWMQAARSPVTPAWSADAALAGLADGFGASWAWKRKPGPRFFPVLTGGKRYSFYVENDNQTLIALENKSGAFRGAYRFPEPLDLKVAAWIGDTLVVSSPTRLYLASPTRGTGILAQVQLSGAVCHSIAVGNSLLLSDWNGNVRRLDPGSGRASWTWETRIGRGGILLARGGESVDAFEIEGAWHSLRFSDGKPLATLPMPPGTITEIHAGRDLAYAGYN